MINLVSGILSEEDKNSILANLYNIDKKLSFLVSLDPQTKKTLFKPGDNFTPFVELCVSVLADHPEIMPSDFNVSEFNKDANLLITLKLIQRRFAKLFQSLEDSILAVGTDVLSGAIDVYAEVKSSQNKIPGLATTAATMKTYFPHSGQNNEKK